MIGRLATALLLLLATTASPLPAAAQLARQPATRPAARNPTNVRAHVGIEYATHLVRSTNADERLRGIRRAAAIGTPEAVSLLAKVTESSPAVRSDSRALIELARALSRFADQGRARDALLLIVNTGNSSTRDDGDPIARVELARQTAAIALAQSPTERALEQLYGIARGGGNGSAAAMLALSIAPPRDPGFYGTAARTMSPALVRLLARLADLRALEILHSAARTEDISTRSAALVALASLGDERALPLARLAFADPDTRLRAAAGEVFTLLSSPEREKAVSALLEDEATMAIGVHLAERVYSAHITELLIARATTHPDHVLRTAAIRALGRSTDANAALALANPTLIGDLEFGHPAAVALARSPARAAMGAIVALAKGRSPSAALGIRAYIVRAIRTGVRDDALDAILERLARSKDGRERALGVFGRAALGATAVAPLLADPDPRVRRAGAVAALATPTAAVLGTLLEHQRTEPDDTTRQVLAIGLAGGDPEGRTTTSRLLERTESGGADAALSAYALAARADASIIAKVEQLLASRDPLLRAHAARGLGESALPDATGRLAEAYEYETDAAVRRAIVAALGRRLVDASAPARRAILDVAARLDPDGPTRSIARFAAPHQPHGGEANTSIPTVGDALDPGPPREVAWLRITLDRFGAPREPYPAAIVRSDGIAVPIAFDDDGFAIIPGLPPGEGKLVLAPRLPPYEAPRP